MMTEELMSALGDDTQINEKKVDWARDVLALVKKGVIFDLHIGRSRFERRITKEELGLDIPDQQFQVFLKEYLAIGTKVLLPRRVKLIFDRIEGRARRALYTHSFESAWGRFVPATAFRQLKTIVAQCAEEYERAKEDLKTNLVKFNAETTADYRKGAIQMYERTHKTKTLVEFTEGLIRSIEAQLPTKELIDETFYCREDIYYIPLPSEIEQDFMKQDLIRRERMLEETKGKAEVDKIRAEVDMHREAIRKITETKAQKLDGMFDSIAQQMKSDIYGGLRDILEGLRGRQSMSPSAVSSLKKRIKHWRMMNFFEDPDIESAAAKLEELTTQRVKRARESATVIAEIAQNFRSFALEQQDIPEVRDIGMLL